MRNIDFGKIEEALGFELTGLQKEVICASDEEFLKMRAPEGRLNYTTTAAALRLLLSEGDTVIDLTEFVPGTHTATLSGAKIKDFMLVSACAGYSGDYKNRRRYLFAFCDTVLKFYNRLWNAGIPVRNVTYGFRDKGIQPASDRRSGTKNEYTLRVCVDKSELNELEKALDRLTEKAQRLAELLKGLSNIDGKGC